jgi:hypothetical protein
VTPPRWIDNERAVENAARDRHVDPNHEVFAGRGFGGTGDKAQTFFHHRTRSTASTPPAEQKRKV